MLDRTASALDSSLSFAVEHFDDVIVEAEPLLAEHWREIAVHQDVPLKPSYLFYRKMDKMGALKIFTARRGGALRRVGQLFEQRPQRNRLYVVEHAAGLQRGEFHHAVHFGRFQAVFHSVGGLKGDPVLSLILTLPQERV